MEQEYFRIGVITEPHGVKGEVKVFPVGDEPGHLKKVKQMFLKEKEGMIPLKPVGFKNQNDRIIIKFEEYADRTAVEKLRKKELYVLREDAVPLKKDEYYVTDLEGLDVYENDEKIGVLKEVQNYGANDVYEIERIDGTSLLLPAIKECILKVDIEGGRIDVSVMEGL